MVAGNGSSGTGVPEPVGYQTFGEFALRVLIWIQRPVLSGVERLPQGLNLRAGAGSRESAELAVKPESSANLQRGVAGAGVGGKDEIQRLHKMRLLMKQSRTSLQRFPQHAELTLLKVVQAAVDNAGTATGGT